MFQRIVNGFKWTLVKEDIKAIIENERNRSREYLKSALHCKKEIINEICY